MSTSLTFSGFVQSVQEIPHLPEINSPEKAKDYVIAQSTAYIARARTLQNREEVIAEITLYTNDILSRIQDLFTNAKTSTQV